MTPEKRVANPCDAYLLSLGAYIFKPVQTGYGKKTIDRLCCINGLFVGVEYKRLGGFPTTMQSRTIKEIAEAGGIAFATDSLERCRDYIEQHVLNQYTPRAE